MPDELRDRHSSGTEPQLIDWLDGLCEFAERLPAWTGPDGLPLSWPHYVCGMAYIGRANLRGMLRAAEAARAAQAVKGYEDWQGLLLSETRRG